MKANILFSITLLLITATAFSQTPTVITAHFDALTKHDVKAIAAGYTDSAKVFSPNWDGAKRGPAGVAEVYTRYFSSTPDLFYKVTNVINAGENVIVEYISGGTLSNPEENTPAYMKNKTYSVSYCAIFTIKDNKITKETDYFDQVAFLRQVGFFDQH